RHIRRAGSNGCPPIDVGNGVTTESAPNIWRWRTAVEHHAGIDVSLERKRLGRPPIAPAGEKRIREPLATPGRPGVRVIAKRFGVDPGTVQRISRPFDGVGIV